MIDIYNRLPNDYAYIPQVETSDGIEQILSQIKMVLGTTPGDVMGQPYFGVNVKKYLFNLSYNQEEINQYVSSAILNSISYDKQLYNVSINIEFGKDKYNRADYAIINISINQQKCLGIIMSH